MMRTVLWRLLLATLVFWVTHAPAQLSLFSYQGRLLQNTQPLSGDYDFQFRLWDQSFDGTALSPTAIIAPVVVKDGTFQVTLDFGSAVLDGSPRWLEIAVRTHGNTGSYTVLSPRQRLTATPYAAFAATAASATLAGALTGGGSSLTNISGTQIRPGSITSNQIDPALDATYRNTDSNAVRMAVGMTNPVATINVKDFGAQGDGLTDDTVAISNAWRTLMSVGGTLYFPPGTYLDSGSHTTGAWMNSAAFANAGYHRDGRLVWGGGSVIWRYTGSGQMFTLMNTAPDFEGIWFEGSGSAATGCILVSTLWNKWSVKKCFFSNWTNTTVGALVAAEADSITASELHFYQCNIGVGLGFNCSNFKGDIRGDRCGTLVAAGVPTPAYPTRRGSSGVSLNLDSVYCGTALAIDAGGPLSANIFAWWNTNGVVWVGAIANVATNSEMIRGLDIHDSWVNHGSTAAQSPILLWQSPYQVLKLRNNSFDFSGSSPRPVVKSIVAGADLAKIDWDGSIAVKLDNIASLAPIFQDSAGINFPERSIGDDVSLNRGLKVYNKANWSSGALGGNYLIDVVDAVYPGANSPIARFGHSWGTGNFADFWGGLSVRYDSALDAPVVGITNAILEVSGNRSSGARVGAVRVAETVNATNGFLIGELRILKGAGSPEGVVDAPTGSLFLRTDGGATSTLYVKTSGNGNTGWTAK